MYSADVSMVTGGGPEYCFRTPRIPVAELGVVGRGVAAVAVVAPVVAVVVRGVETGAATVAFGEGVSVGAASGWPVGCNTHAAITTASKSRVSKIGSFIASSSWSPVGLLRG